MITQENSKTAFSYGPNREVYKRIDTRDGQQTQTLYLGGYERVKLPSGVIEHKFYIGNVVITERSNNANDEFYLHKDHQNSTTSITNASGMVVQQFIYDPWGRQYNVHSNSLFSAYSSPGISQGYTGHKMINDMDIIHMNGRTYNSTFGRFLQADPHIQSPLNSQNYNRYSYVLNNPMSMTDPSGYFFKWLAKKSMKHAGHAFALAGLATGGITAGISNYWLYDRAMNSNGTAAIVNVGLNFIPGCQVWCSAAFSAQRAYYQTGSLSAAFHSGGRSAAISGAFMAIGSAFGDKGGFWEKNSIQHIGFHAITGGIIADVQGGSFGHGFFSAVITKGFHASGEVSNDMVIGTVQSAVVGGTASVISGGKFANGAVTAAFQYLYNYTKFQQTLRDRTRQVMADFATKGIVFGQYQDMQEFLRGMSIEDYAKMFGRQKYDVFRIGTEAFYMSEQLSRDVTWVKGGAWDTGIDSLKLMFDVSTGNLLGSTIAIHGFTISQTPVTNLSPALMLQFYGKAYYGN